ncbi:rhodanese-like domain-containing protein [Luteolibacter sp. AS25]|uniref:rhodanese-like domain-containing protein n=1 Tax=Luteolibacter sp. AS25 TaxID=3135776 RepID=UPI00398A9CC5
MEATFSSASALIPKFPLDSVFIYSNIGIYSHITTFKTKSIQPQAANELVSKGESILLDVRTDVEFAEQHVPGALHIQLDRLDSGCGKLDRDAHFSLLCLGGKRAERAAGILAEKGFNKLSVVEGGITSWKSSGLPVNQTERKVLPLMRQVQLVVGVLSLIGSLAAIFINPLFAVLPAFLGAGLTFAGSTGWCGLAVLLSKAPWNRCKKATGSCCAAYILS